MSINHNQSMFQLFPIFLLVSPPAKCRAEKKGPVKKGSQVFKSLRKGQLMTKSKPNGKVLQYCDI